MGKRYTAAYLLAVAVGAGMIAGCTTRTADSAAVAAARHIDFGKAWDLMLPLMETVPDAELIAKYQTATNEVIVRDARVDGDFTMARYMLIKDHAAGTQTIYLPGADSRTLFQFHLTVEWDPVLNCHVNTTFRRGTQVVLKDILPLLEADQPIVISGYSLGGSIALMLAQHLLRAGYDVADVETFGQMKITDAAGVASFADVPLLRFVSYSDVVPHLPMSVTPTASPFVQFGPEVILYDSPEYSYLEPGWPGYAESSFMNVLWVLHNTQLDKHFGVLYFQRMTNKVGQVVQVPYPE